MDIKHNMDAISASVALATLVDWLPSIAAVFTILWTMLRIVESLCALGWIKCRKSS